MSAETMAKEIGLDKINMDVKKKIMEEAKINETQLTKIEQLFEEGIAVRGTIDQDLSITIKNGTGTAKLSKTTWWVSISGNATIKSPDEGSWHIVVKDGNDIIFDKRDVKKGQIIDFKYKTGFKLNLNATAEWSEKKDTTLVIHLHLNY
jgi:hypothetical protein